ncbi:WD40-repeat-containing domain protein [Aspergillus karnatakaensis]|uniref:tRNA (34-2'-O)-methyltransferase regulator RTT10 n=1 Tax=Aspergillus karnatakaensis TaxID=1810916 RepID=UPI003CCE2B9C
MDASLEHIDACLPVTTLKAFDFENERLVLAGQGPFARLVEERTGKVLEYLRVFKRNNVHGYTTLHRKDQDRATHVRLLVWGDRSFRLIDLDYSRPSSDDPVVKLTASTAEFLAPDWIMAGCSAGEGSTAYLVTAHNAVQSVAVTEDPSSKYGRSLHLRQLAVGINTILFSADIIPVSPSNLLVAAGTVFGEIIVWSCFPPSNEDSGTDVMSSIHHFFTGHEGSVFDVQISPEIADLHSGRPGRLLATCSDDRTVRIWDISDCVNASPEKPSAYSTDGFELRCTGFGHVKDEKELDSESCVASAFGHGSRIWGVHFFAKQFTQGKINLVSRGEDGYCYVWDLTWETSLPQKSEFALASTCSLRTHNGKHAWALAMSTIGAQTTVYTGGNDGAVRSFELVEEAGQVVCPNRNTQITVIPNSGGKKEGAKEALKAFSFVTSDCFLATTMAGEVQTGYMEDPNSINRRVTRKTLFVEEDLRGYGIISGLTQKGVALIGNHKGLVRFYDHQAESLTLVANVGQRPVGLHLLDYHSAPESPAVITFLTTYVNPLIAELFYIHLMPNKEPQVHKVALHLSQGFEVSCASLIHNKDYLGLGSRYGSFAVFRMQKAESLQAILKVSRIHSKEGMNAIISVPSLSPAANTQSAHFLTCGRDGAYRISVLDISEDSADTVSLRTVHSPTNLAGWNVEGAYVDTTTNDLMIYGFSSMSFAIWNESTQSEVAKVHCGGSHRRWAFQPSAERPGEGLLVWYQGGFNACYINDQNTRSIRAGGHGREIKTLGAYQPTDGGSPLFVTGSEDTSLRVFRPRTPDTPLYWGALESIRNLTAHDSGPQHISFSKDGRYLFTSSAMEDFFVWKISSIPVFGLTAAKLGSCPKSQPNSELRVTCFDVLEVEEEKAEASFLLCLTYSNSTIKVFHLSCVNDDGHFTLLASGTYTSNCLTQVRFLQTTSSLCLITTSTDGHFTLWDLTNVLETHYDFGSILRLKQSLSSSSTKEDSITCESRHQIHSNSIKSLEVLQLSETTTLLITGGDDNSITLTLLATDINDTDKTPRATTISIPDAHAASVNAVKIIGQSILRKDKTLHLSFASSGNDHRVKLWKVDIDLKDRPTLDGIEVRNIFDQYSPVADISSLDVVSDQEEIKLLVCGVGMEFFKVRL